ncbi:MAG: hypothetical protein Q4C48_05070 [Lachnospiraceae bacterium]|nr:hypothetical protein [Lachnospiraceae bacterium]
MKKVTKFALLAALAGGGYYLYQKTKQQKQTDEFEEADLFCDDEISDDFCETESTQASRDAKIDSFTEKAEKAVRTAAEKTEELSHVVAENANKAAKAAMKKADELKDYMAKKASETTAEATGETSDTESADDIKEDTFAFTDAVDPE